MTLTKANIVVEVENKTAIVCTFIDVLHFFRSKRLFRNRIYS